MFIEIRAFTSEGQQVDSTVITTSQEDVQVWIDDRKNTWPDGTTTTVTDYTQRFADQDDASRGMRAMEVGNQCVALAYAINDRKQLPTEALNAMFADPTLAFAERLLKNGALATGKAVLQSVDAKFFTADEIKRVTDFIDRALDPNTQ